MPNGAGTVLWAAAPQWGMVALHDDDIRTFPGVSAVTDQRLPQLSLHTPVGDLSLSEEDGALVSLDWGWGSLQSPTPLLCAAREQLHAYFDGTRTTFDIPLAPQGTVYRRRVWQVLCSVPPGETRSYAQLAALAGGSARSVGTAMATNPIPIFIPCHRVVGSAGPGGYSGGDGLPTKHFLLALERRTLSSSTAQPPLELT
jgi:methylated-DNA-[protein]-cysteine S-methyltransferase